MFFQKAEIPQCGFLMEEAEMLWFKALAKLPKSADPEFS